MAAGGFIMHCKLCFCSDNCDFCSAYWVFWSPDCHLVCKVCRLVRKMKFWFVVRKTVLLTLRLCPLVYNLGSAGPLMGYSGSQTGYSGLDTGSFRFRCVSFGTHAWAFGPQTGCSSCSGLHTVFCSRNCVCWLSNWLFWFTDWVFCTTEDCFHEWNLDLLVHRVWDLVHRLGLLVYRRCF